jgi:hypothetical protein
MAKKKIEKQEEIVEPTVEFPYEVLNNGRVLTVTGRNAKGELMATDGCTYTE